MHPDNSPSPTRDQVLVGFKVVSSFSMNTQKATPDVWTLSKQFPDDQTFPWVDFHTIPSAGHENNIAI